MPASACSDVLKKSSGTDHQYAPQHFVTSTCNPPQSDLSCGRMVFGRESYPSGKVATRLEHSGVLGSSSSIVMRRPARHPEFRPGACCIHRSDATQSASRRRLSFRQAGLDTRSHAWQKARGPIQARIDPLQQRFNAAHASGCHDAELHGKPAYGIGKLRSIANEPLSQADQHQRRLLVSSLHQHEPHGRPAHRLTQSLRVRRVVLAAFYMRLRQLRRDQFHFVPQGA